MAENKPRVLEESDIVPKSFSGLKEDLTLEVYLDHARSESYKVGIRVGYENAATHVMVKALELFRGGKRDDEAMRLRKLSDELTVLSKEQK